MWKDGPNSADSNLIIEAQNETGVLRLVAFLTPQTLGIRQGCFPDIVPHW